MLNFANLWESTLVGTVHIFANGCKVKRNGDRVGFYKPGDTAPRHNLLIAATDAERFAAHCRGFIR